MPQGKGSRIQKTYDKYKDRLTVEEFMEIAYNGYRVFAPEGMTIGSMYVKLKNKKYHGTTDSEIVEWSSIKRMLKCEKEYLLLTGFTKKELENLWEKK